VAGIKAGSAVASWFPGPALLPVVMGSSTPALPTRCRLLIQKRQHGAAVKFRIAARFIRMALPPTLAGHLEGVSAEGAQAQAVGEGQAEPLPYSRTLGSHLPAFGNNLYLLCSISQIGNYHHLIFSKK